MPIDVTCPGCRKMLRAPDTLAGKRVKCPQCGGAIAVPAPVAAAPPAPAFGGVADLIDEAIQEEVAKRKAAEEAEYERQQEEAVRSVYESPKAQAAEKREKGLTRFRKRQLDIGAAFSRGWSTFTANYGLALLTSLFTVLLGTIGYVVTLGTFIFLGVLAGSLFDRTAGIERMIAFMLLFFVGYGVAPVVPAWLTTGMANCFLKMAKGEPAEFADMFRAGKHTISMWGGMVLIAVIQFIPSLPNFLTVVWEQMTGEAPSSTVRWIALGSSLVLLPGMYYLLLRSMMFVFALVDLNLGAAESISTSKEISQGNILRLLLLYVVLGLINVAGMMMACLGFLFLSLPLTAMIVAVAYTDMTGQRPR